MSKELSGEQLAFIKPNYKGKSTSYSYGALALGIFYYFAMECWWYALVIIISIITGFVALGDGLSGWFLFPLMTLFLLPVTAREQAWKKRKWKNFAEFQSVQNAWDRWGKAFLFIDALLLGLSFLLTYES